MWTVFNFIKKLHSDGKQIMLSERIEDPLQLSKALTAAEKLLDGVDPEVRRLPCARKAQHT